MLWSITVKIVVLLIVVIETTVEMLSWWLIEIGEMRLKISVREVGGGWVYLIIVVRLMMLLVIIK